MKIGRLLILEVRDTKSGEICKYRCKIVEKNDNYLFIDHPIDVKTKRTTFFPKKTSFIATYVGEDQVVYKFPSEVNAIVKLTIPTLAITLPEKNKIKKIQRRQYVRIETAVDAAVHSRNEDHEPFTTVSTDISGGGISVIIPNDKTMESNEKLDLWIVLPMNDGKLNYVYAETEVIRIKQLEGTVQTGSIKFTVIAKKDQQSIIQFCFEKQREARQKEMM
ncbi:flagellar brake protein [Virgibacillus byunsanensis]|uniref:Flagellar brake protein n=1 Tax=Virgibacillus byunsanensis TaxID=570945 RepID=A0ABW3LNJ8_9BACI